MRRLPVFAASASRVSSLSPTLSTVSIMPGIESAAPERTETSTGDGPLPNVAPRIFSTRARCTPTSLQSDSESFPPARQYCSQTSVVIVKPGGTGKDIRAISARFAPLPPSSAFMSLSPSALPSPKK